MVVARTATRLILGLLAVFSLTEVSAQQQEDQRKKYNGKLDPGIWHEDWSKTLDAHLEQSSLLNHKEKQIEVLCPGYGAQPPKRKIFWQQLMLSLGWKESLHGPGNWVEFRGGRNNGLYQINPELRNYYECGDIDLFDPHANIICAVKMAKRLVDRFGTFLKGRKGGMAAYWQPLRGSSAYNRRSRAFILGFVKEACKHNTLYYHSRGFQFEEVFGADYSPDESFNSLEDIDLPDDESIDPIQSFLFDIE